MLRRLKEKLRDRADTKLSFRLFYLRTRNLFMCLTAWVPNGIYAKWFYKLYTGKKLNLKNPTSFDEKLWWLKLNNFDLLLTRCADKAAVRDYVAEKGFSDILVPLIDMWTDAAGIDFDALGTECMLKPSFGSGDNMYFQRGGAWDTLQGRRAVQKILRMALRQKYYLLSRERHYKNIPPRILAEKVLRDKNGRLPLDYKFFCFDGEPRILTLDLGVLHQDGSLNHGYLRNVYDMQFQLLPMKETRENADIPVEKPQNWARMLDICRALSAPFPFCRVDLYNIDGAVYFGEMTFYHGGGCNDIRPPEWEARLASWIDLDSEKIVRRRAVHG